MTFQNSLVIGLLVVAGCFTSYLAVIVFRSEQGLSQSAQQLSRSAIARYVLSACCMATGIGLCGAAIYATFIAASGVEGQGNGSGVVVNDEVREALEGAVAHRIVDQEGLEVLERWLNAFIRPTPSVNSRPMVTVSVDAPNRVIEKIATGLPVSGEERTQLLMWLAFDSYVNVDATIGDLLKTVVIGGKVNDEERGMVVKWLENAATYPPRRDEKAFPHQVDRVQDDASAPAPAPSTETVAPDGDAK